MKLFPGEHHKYGLRKLYEKLKLFERRGREGTHIPSVEKKMIPKTIEDKHV